MSYQLYFGYMSFRDRHSAGIANKYLQNDFFIIPYGKEIVIKSDFNCEKRFSNKCN